MAILFAFREDRFGFRFQIGDRAVLGRSPDCQLILFDRAASRRHAEIYLSEDGYVLKDLGSTNGIVLNGQPLVDEALLKQNDEITVGQEVFLFDPNLDVSVGPEGAVLIVGDVETVPEGAIAQPSEINLVDLDRSWLAPLYQVALALSFKPNQRRVLKQSVYALNKMFGATGLALLWPESAETERLTTLMVRPLDRRPVLPQPLVDLVVNENQAVIWPYVFTSVDFVQGERQLDWAPFSAMAIPLKAHGNLPGLLYVECDNRVYSSRELNFFQAFGSLVSAALINAGLIKQLEHRLVRDEENLGADGDFIGNDHQVKALLGTAHQIAQTEARIHLTGEMGTGKEFLAKRIHAVSPRRRGPFLTINCSAAVAGQVESALFGQEAGTMGEEGVPGLLEQSEGGTLFIRHVDHLPLSAQVELLRAMEEGVVYRIGSAKPRPINIRVISSTTADLDHLVALGEFREDLYRRLAEMILEMPPLRDIKDDIVTLCRHFLSQAARDRGVPMPELDPAAGDCLRAYSWPGNVGELKNMVERLIMFSGGDRICVEDLNPDVRYATQVFQTMAGELDSGPVAEVERLMIRRAMIRTQSDSAEAARMLGLSESDLTTLIEHYDIRIR